MIEAMFNGATGFGVELSPANNASCADHAHEKPLCRRAMIFSPDLIVREARP